MRLLTQYLLSLDISIVEGFNRASKRAGIKNPSCLIPRPITYCTVCTTWVTRRKLPQEHLQPEVAFPLTGQALYIWDSTASDMRYQPQLRWRAVVEMGKSGAITAECGTAAMASG